MSLPVSYTLRTALGGLLGMPCYQQDLVKVVFLAPDSDAGSTTRTACSLVFPGRRYQVYVETDPAFVGESFCHTVLFPNEEGLVAAHAEQLGYDPANLVDAGTYPLRAHESPSSFMHHIQDLASFLHGNSQYAAMVVK